VSASAATSPLIPLRARLRLRAADCDAGPDSSSSLLSSMGVSFEEPSETRLRLDLLLMVDDAAAVAAPAAAARFLGADLGGEVGLVTASKEPCAERAREEDRDFVLMGVAMQIGDCARASTRAV
jgi:hypothetical protein